MSDPHGRPKDHEGPPGGIARSAREPNTSDPHCRPKDREVPPGGVERGFHGALLRARGTGRLCQGGPGTRSAREPL